jgi:hypothetical protein
MHRPDSAWLGGASGGAETMWKLTWETGLACLSRQNLARTKQNETGSEERAPAKAAARKKCFF